MSTAADTRAARLRLRLHRIEHAADGIHLFEFRSIDGSLLPPFTAGAHVDLHLGNGLVRSYSLANPQGERHRYVVGVKRDAKSRGGSAWLHEQARVGTLMEVDPPRNLFPLDEDAPLSVLIGGGIGITPLACMVQRLRELGRPWRLHYGVRRRDEAALLDVLDGPELDLHVDEERQQVLDVPALVAGAPAGASLYACGPAPLLEAFEQAARMRQDVRWHLERFAAPPAPPVTAGEGFRVRLARSGQTVHVARGQTILDVVRAAGVDVQASCEQGICGTCETAVLGGRPDHRDFLLSEAERATQRVMMICCSGSLDDELVLDL